MTRVEQIEQEIEALPLEQQVEVAQWLSGGEDDEWNRQMKEDAAAGRLDPWIEEARREVAEGKGTPPPGAPDARCTGGGAAADTSSK